MADGIGGQRRNGEPQEPPRSGGNVECARRSQSRAGTNRLPTSPARMAVANRSAALPSEMRFTGPSNGWWSDCNVESAPEPLRQGSWRI